MAGYSGTPLTKKLGLKAGHRLVLLNAPPGFLASLPDLPEDVMVQENLSGRVKANVILFFTKDFAELKKTFKKLIEQLDPSGGLWICWPKKASKVATDLTEDVIRNHALEMGLVDNKVCAIDDIWSGLRLVVRLVDRPGKGKQTVRKAT